jgi:hypothetical protein
MFDEGNLNIGKFIWTRTMDKSLILLMPAGI